MSVASESFHAELGSPEACLPHYQSGGESPDVEEEHEDVFRVQKPWWRFGRKCDCKVWTRWLLAAFLAFFFVGGLVVLVMYFAGGSSLFGGGTTACPHPTGLNRGESVVCFQADADKYVLNGADIVAYYSLEQGARAIQGDVKNPMKTTNHYGRLFAFSTEDNKNAFLDTPTRFLPQYGGFCSWALGTRFEFERSSPHAWNIVDGKLYMNANEEVQKTFREDPSRYITKSDTYWATLKYDNPPGTL